MKKEDNEVLEAKIAERNERAKKLYRYISDGARRIDEATAASRTLTDLFSTNSEVQRQKLRDNCEKLLFLDPLNYGKKSLELLWRKVYYETVSTAKKLKESDDGCDSYLFTHIVCGIGHFHHLITKIQSELKIRFMELDYTPLHRDEETEEVNVVPKDEDLQYGRSAVHSCLIYLGDLSRYQAEIFHTIEYASIAARCYLQAALVDMSSGMPYNQLGNLYLDKNYNLDSVCYYIHCLSSLSPFEGAIGNLTKIFEKNAQYSEALNVSTSMSQSEHVQNSITNFLSLIEIWYMSKNDTNIPQRCNTIAHELKLAMDFNRTPLPDINKSYKEHMQAIEEETINPSYLNSNLVYKIIQICLFTVAKMNETDEHKAFACKAFTLALLSQLLQKLLKQIESFGLKNPARKFHPRAKLGLFQETETKTDKCTIEVVNGETETQPIIANGVKEDTENDEQTEILSKENESDGDPNKLQNGDLKTNKKALAKRRRRRRIVSSESSDLSDADTDSSEDEVDESCSAEEHTSDFGNHSDESDSCFSEGSDTEDTAEKTNETVKHENSKTVEDVKTDKSSGGINNADNKIGNSDTSNTENKLDFQEIQNFLLGDNFLPSIKLLQDWVLSEKDLILSCGDSGESLFQCVVDLLNIFTYYFNPKNNNDVIKNNECRILDYAKSVAKNLKLEYKTIPLPEDIDLRGTNVCKFDKDAAEWNILDKYKPTVYEENIMRILNFIDFGNQIAKIVPRIRFNRSLRVFYLKKIPPPKLNTKINHKRSREWHHSKKTHTEASEGGLLRRLGRLWLASQVRELELSGRTAAPELLALDAAALHTHLRRIKQLLRTKNFILLVPTVVLQELDELKRECSGARDAIRWLEMQLRCGSRFLRAQRPGQSRPLPFLKYPRKAPPHIYNYIQILEFCNHFVADEKQGGGGEPDGSVKTSSLFMLLVGSDPEECKEFSPTGAARAAGISIQRVEDFYAKWRRTVHKNSSKR